MSFPTIVNGQVTDAVTQVNTKAPGDSPGMAMGNFFMATTQALANAAHNATNNQPQSYIMVQAATTKGMATLYVIDKATTSLVAMKKMPHSQEAAGQA
jgi:hypothetical protein